MHPREGWTEDMRAGGLSRRGFLKQGAAAGLLAAGAGSLLPGCSSGGTTATTSGAKTTGGIPLPRPNSPVTWPLFKDNPAIKSGLAPEQNATLRLFNWVAYINPQSLKDFGKKYKCKVEVTTFQNMDAALAKLRSGRLNFDVFFPTVDVIGPLVESKLIRPINHSYVPNIVNAWPDFTNPFYDQDWQYTVPYTIYTTGISWRKDKVPEDPYKMKSGWDMPWLSAKYKGKVAILDDYREGLCLGLLRNGIYDLNTTDPAKIAVAKQSLQDLQRLVAVQIDNNDYTYVPSGRIWIHHAWGGDMAAAAQYMPKGVPVEVVGYWFPQDGRGPVANDTIAILNSGKNPVLAHEFVNYMLGVNTVFENITFNGYMQPLNDVTPKALIDQKILPPSLESTVVLPSYFRAGIQELELSPAVTSMWEQAWSQFGGGL